MNSYRQKSGVISGVLLPVGLVCLFAFCSLALALMGGQAYRGITSDIDDSYGSTVAVNYLRTKLSQNNQAGAVSIRQLAGLDVLVIESESGGNQYETRIFVYDGSLCESFVSASQPLEPTNSVEIAKISECHFSISEDGLFEAEIVSPLGVPARMAYALVPEVSP